MHNWGPSRECRSTGLGVPARRRLGAGWGVLLCPDGQRPALGQGSLCPLNSAPSPVWMSYRSEPAVSRGLISVPRGPLWKSHSVQCSSAVTLGCAVALLDTRVSGDGPGGLQLRDGFCLVSFLRSRKSTPCWVEPVKPSPGS